VKGMRGHEGCVVRSQCLRTKESGENEAGLFSEIY